MADLVVTLKVTLLIPQLIAHHTILFSFYNLNNNKMKALLISLSTIFMITASVTHIWTVYIAFTESGIGACILTLILPFLSELYWMFKMFGENDTYAYIALIHLVLSVFYGFFGTSNK